MVSLTNFQRACEEELSRILILRGLDVPKRITGKIESDMFGEEELYLKYNIKQGIIEVFFYHDEAEIKFPDGGVVFETPDFDSLIELQNAFFAKLKEVLSEY